MKICQYADKVSCEIVFLKSLKLAGETSMFYTHCGYYVLFFIIGVPWCTSGGHRTTDGSVSLPPPFRRVPGVKLRWSGLCSKHCPAEPHHSPKGGCYD